MTAVKEMLKELQEKFPKQMADMYDSNQLLLEDIALKAKKIEKIEKEKLWTNEEVFDMLYKTDKFLMIELREYWKTIEK